LPQNTLAPVVIGSHGLFSDKNSPKQIHLARQCSRNGIAYFRFDHRGCGESQGHFFEATSFEARVTDYIRAVQTMRARKDTGNPIACFGSSLGAAVCMAAAATVRPAAMVVNAAPVRSKSVIPSVEIAKNGTPSVPAGYTVNLRFDLSRKLSGLHHILIFHGDNDTLVSPSNAHEIFAAARDPKKLIIQPGGDHRMSDETHQNMFIDESILWFKAALASFNSES
jgi:alpha-beta hydrolase superfamily lysophospholipase